MGIRMSNAARNIPGTPLGASVQMHSNRCILKSEFLVVGDTAKQPNEGVVPYCPPLKVCGNSSCSTT